MEERMRAGEEPKPPRALVGNAADEKQVREAKLTEKQRAFRQAEDFRAVLAGSASPVQIDRVFWALLERANVFSSPFTGNDAHTNFNCGKQAFGQDLMARIIEAGPEYFLRMQTTNQREKANAE